LRERENDILLIAQHFVKEYCKDNKSPLISIDSSAKNKLLKYHWPGNVRELKAVIELACVMADENKIEDKDVIFNSSNSMQDLLFMELSLKDYTRKIIQSYLEKYDYNVLLVADKLDIGKSTIYRMIQNNELEMK
jgi:DNA-binding NtrC family response regulator